MYMFTRRINLFTFYEYLKYFNSTQCSKDSYNKFSVFKDVIQLFLKSLKYWYIQIVLFFPLIYNCGIGFFSYNIAPKHEKAQLKPAFYSLWLDSAYKNLTLQLFPLSDLQTGIIGWAYEILCRFTSYSLLFNTGVLR